MVKVLIYSSKDLYDKSSFEGRAEANIIAYRDDEFYYKIIKNRTSQYMSDRESRYRLEFIIEREEHAEWKQDLKSFKLKESYRDHPYTTLMKNEVPDV